MILNIFFLFHFNYLSYIDHGNGFLCLRIHDAFDLDSGCYNCIVTTIDGLQCSTFTNLNIGRNSEIIDDNGLAVMKSPLPVVADCGVKATFCARVFPTDAQVFWFVCGRMVMENHEFDDSCEFTVSCFVFFFIIWVLFIFLLFFCYSFFVVLQQQKEKKICIICLKIRQLCLQVIKKILSLSDALKPSARVI